MADMHRSCRARSSWEMAKDQGPYSPGVRDVWSTLAPGRELNTAFAYAVVVVSPHVAGSLSPDAAARRSAATKS